MLIREHELDVSIEDELELYIDQLDKAKVRGHKIQACSPFRTEGTPSFAVNLETGTWIDSGASDDNWSKGNFIKLLAYLQGVTYGEAEDYLLDKYKYILADTDSLTLNVQLEQEKKYRDVTQADIEPFMFRSPYLGKRGISEKVQRAFKIGYDKKNRAITMVWADKDGKPINIKFRSVKDKRFWYLPDDEDENSGEPIKQHIYGFHFVKDMADKRIFVTESETDALYLWSHKIPAIALGSASMSKRQEELLLNSGITDLVLAFDNDTAGIRCKGNVIKRLMGKINLWEFQMPAGCKDVNDIAPNNILNILNKIKKVSPSFM